MRRKTTHLTLGELADVLRRVEALQRESSALARGSYNHPCTRLWQPLAGLSRSLREATGAAGHAVHLLERHPRQGGDDA